MKETELLYENKNIAERFPEDIRPASEFCEGYKAFLDASKTEREAAAFIAAEAEKHGYTVFSRNNTYQEGDSFYTVNRKKTVILVTMGTRPLSEGVRFNIAHIDSPRLDLKPNPLYEKDELAYFKTHYYGGIRKYQWTAVPLSMHGIVCFKDGSSAELCIGESEEDPKFFITDLLPHLSAKQDERTLKQGIRGEELNILTGSIPLSGEEKDPVKVMVLKLLHEKYGMTEADFLRAEIEMVPAAKASDIGLDRSLIGAYGQDDRVCAYTAMEAAFRVRHPEYTTVTVLTDKEEIGSEGTTGMASRYLHDFLLDLCEESGTRVRDLYRHSRCISSDVNSAFDPTFPDVFEKNNSSLINHGPAITKYTGARGKSGANDASAEMLAFVTAAMDRNHVAWQTGELGKVDEGGGGTIAKFIAAYDVDTVDLGVPVLAMHAPYEVTSKLDVYHTFKAYEAFLQS